MHKIAVRMWYSFQLLQLDHSLFVLKSAVSTVPLPVMVTILMHKILLNSAFLDQYKYSLSVLLLYIDAEIEIKITSLFVTTQKSTYSAFSEIKCFRSRNTASHGTFTTFMFVL